MILQLLVVPGPLRPQESEISLRGAGINDVLDGAPQLDHELKTMRLAVTVGRVIVE